MAYNYLIKKESIDEITKNTFKEAIFLSYKDGIKTIAPLGLSGDDIVIFGKKKDNRKSIVSIRNYCGDAELLITDINGHFIFYGRYDIDMGIDFVCEQYWQMFNKVKNKIETIMPNKSKFENLKINSDCEVSEEFAMLKAYQEKKDLFETLSENLEPHKLKK